MDVDQRDRRIRELRIRDDGSRSTGDRARARRSNLSRRQLLGHIDRCKRDVVRRGRFEGRPYLRPYAGRHVAGVGFVTRHGDIRLIVKCRLHEDSGAVTPFDRRTVSPRHTESIVEDLGFALDPPLPWGPDRSYVFPEGPVFELAPL